MSPSARFSRGLRRQGEATAAFYRARDAAEGKRLWTEAGEATDAMIDAISESERTGVAFTRDGSQWLHCADIQLSFDACFAGARYRLLEAVAGSPAARATLCGKGRVLVENHRVATQSARAELLAERAELLALLAEVAGGALTATVTLPAGDGVAFADVLEALRYGPGSAEYRKSETGWKTRVATR